MPPPQGKQVFQRLCLREAAAAAVGDLLDEHAALAATVRRVADLVVESAPASAGSAAGLAEGGHHFVALGRCPMALEDAVFFPAAAAALSRADWDELDFQVFYGVDALFREPVERRFHSLRADIFGA